MRKRLQFEKTRSSDWFNETPVRGQSAGLARIPRRDVELSRGAGFSVADIFLCAAWRVCGICRLRTNILLALMCFGAILLARVAVVQTGTAGLAYVFRAGTGIDDLVCSARVDHRGIGDRSIASSRKDFSFLPSLAFAVVLLTNLVLLVGTVRARNLRWRKWKRWKWFDGWAFVEERFCCVGRGRRG